VRLPRVSPIIAGAEGFAFRSATDVVVEANAHAYASKATRTTGGLRFGKIVREIVVHGDRRGEFDRTGKPRFSVAAPFDDYEEPRETRARAGHPRHGRFALRNRRRHR
jgi:hypothetical protein